jgi:hypothetical protein
MRTTDGWLIAGDTGGLVSLLHGGSCHTENMILHSYKQPNAQVAQMPFYPHLVCRFADSADAGSSAGDAAAGHIPWPAIH